MESGKRFYIIFECKLLRNSTVSSADLGKKLADTLQRYPTLLQACEDLRFCMVFSVYQKNLKVEVCDIVDVALQQLERPKLRGSLSGSVVLLGEEHLRTLFTPSLSDAVFFASE